MQTPINVTDAAIILVIVLSGVFAFVRGLAHELLAIVAWVGAGVATVLAFPFAQPETRKFIAIPLVADIATAVVIFLLVLVLLSVLTRILSDRVRNSSLGPLDRSLGLIYGFARGAAVVCLAWLALLWVLPREDHPEWLREARSLPLVERGSAMLAGLVPARMRDSLPAPAAPEGGAEVEQNFQSLLNPVPKADASPGEPGYNPRMRDEMQRAIEAISQ